MQQEVEQSAIVLVATPGVVERLHEVVAAGWEGPVVVVPTLAEAQELMSVEAQELPVRPRVMLDPDRQTVTVAGGEVHLTPLEFGLLRTLLAQPGRTLTFAELAEQVWRTRYVGDPAQVHSVVKRVRRKLADIHSPLQVDTVRGVGLRVLGG